MTADRPWMPATQLLADGLGWAEGPAVHSDGRVFFVETFRSRVSVWEPGTGVREFCDTAGGPNACVLSADGSLLVCQNGGTAGPWRAQVMVSPSIQWISPDGATVETVISEIDGVALNGPNDLVWSPDGNLYFTDPGAYQPKDPQPSRIYGITPAGDGFLVAEIDPPSFPNGIAVTDDGELVWAESYTGLVKRITRAGIETVARLPGEHPVADGLAIASNRDLYVTTVNGGGIEVISWSGDYRRHIPCGQIPTNCVFTGDGDLIMTDAGMIADSPDSSYVGQLWRIAAGDSGCGTWHGTMERGLARE